MKSEEHTSRWVRQIVQRLKPAFGGTPVFCEDPDGLLEQGEVREAFLKSGMQLDFWDGELEALERWKCLPDDLELLIVVAEGAPRHQVERHLQNHLWLAIGVADLFGKFDPDIVQAVPVERWDALLELHDEERPHATTEQTALMVARALYGMDVRYMRLEEDWVDRLLEVAVDGKGIPLRVVRGALSALSIGLPVETEQLAEGLSDPSNARLVSHEWLSERQELSEKLQRSHRILLDYLQKQVSEQAQRVAPAVPLLDSWREKSGSIPGVLKFAIEYGQAQANGQVSSNLQREINDLFTSWIRDTYSQVLSTNHPEVFRLHRLLDHLDEEVGAGRFVLFVVDALGLHPWFVVESTWQSDGLIAGADVNAAFAILPTVTSYSRRALFEGKLPSQFGPGHHGQQLERKLWKQRFGEAGTYATTKEPTLISDAMARGQSRICLVDVEWDKLGHSLDPGFISISDAAAGWAGNTPLRDVIREALSNGYRVFLTADHGQLACTGKGRLGAGSFPEERSKRVAIFDSEQLFRQHADEGISVFQPMGLPHGRHVLFAPDLTSFDLDKAVGVSHGGMSIDEVCVPFVELQP